MKTLGFIGMGNMAKAIAEGIIKSGKMSGQDVYAYAPHQDKLQKNAEAIGFVPCASMEALLEASDTVVMACKPYQIEGVLEMYRDALAGKALVSIAAGWDFARYKPLLDASTRVQFIMPNTPAMVGEGVMLFEETHSLEEEERKELFDLFSALGLVDFYVVPHLDNEEMGEGARKIIETYGDRLDLKVITDEQAILVENDKAVIFDR